MSPPIDPDIYDLREKIVLNRYNTKVLKQTLQDLRGVDSEGADRLRALIQAYLGVSDQRDAERGLKSISRMPPEELEDYCERYRNHRPRLIELIDALEGISNPMVQGIRDRAVEIVDNWHNPFQDRSLAKVQFKGAESVTRALQDKAILDLEAMAERNWDNRAELELIRSEMKHRPTNAPHNRLDSFEMWSKHSHQGSPKPDPFNSQNP